jgi:hypothetical protein
MAAVDRIILFPSSHFNISAAISFSTATLLWPWPVIIRSGCSFSCARISSTRSIWVTKAYLKAVCASISRTALVTTPDALWVGGSSGTGSGNCTSSNPFRTARVFRLRWDAACRTLVTCARRFGTKASIYFRNVQKLRPQHSPAGLMSASHRATVRTLCPFTRRLTICSKISGGRVFSVARWLSELTRKTKHFLGQVPH